MFMLDDEYQRALSKRIGDPQRRPETWQIVNDPTYSKQRRWLSEVGASLSVEKQRRVLSRLENKKTFLAMYNELAALALLQQNADTRTEYEPHFDRGNKQYSPDFALYSRRGELVGIAELATRFRTDDQRNIEGRWRKLASRISTIPIGVLLGVANPELGPPDDRTAKSIVHGLKRWLLRPGLLYPNLPYCRVDEYVFQIVIYTKEMRATLHVPMTGGAYSSDLLEEPIREKVKQYAPLASAYGVPLIVILASEPWLPLSAESLESYLCGKSMITFSLDPIGAGARQLAPLQAKLSSGIPPRFDPSLSLVAWLDSARDHPGSLTPFPIVTAERPEEGSAWNLSRAPAIHLPAQMKSMRPLRRS